MIFQENKRILLVEDQLLIGMVTKAILETNGYKVITEASGEDAIATISVTPNIDLILMDIDLGDGINGIEAAKIILQKHDIPLIFLSSHAEAEVIEKTKSITSYGYIIKDSSDTVMLPSIHAALVLFETNKKLRVNGQRKFRDRPCSLGHLVPLKTIKSLLRKEAFFLSAIWRIFV